MSSTSPASATSADTPPRVVEDCLGLLQLLSDGTVQRAVVPLVLTGTSSQTASPVPWKDVAYDEARGLSLRMYVPPPDDTGKKLPVLVYFHGGGFCVGSFAAPNFHDACLRLAAELPAVVLSVDYRLAPENRLPAALEDIQALFSWLRGQAAAADAGTADFGRVFVTGDSAGANIAHHVAIRVGSGALDPGPVLRIAGYVFLWPFFGGERRTPSEAACPPDVFLSLALNDQMWRLALPAGASRDHPAANPFGPDSPPLDGVELPPVLVAVGSSDMLVDRIADYVAQLKAAGKRVELVEFPGQGHGFLVFDPHGEAAAELVRVVRRFVHGPAGAQLIQLSVVVLLVWSGPCAPSSCDLVSLVTNLSFPHMRECVATVK